MTTSWRSLLGPRLLSVVALLGAVMASSVATATTPASSTGALSVSSTGAATTEIVLARGERIVTDHAAIEGPKDVHVSYGGTWAALLIRGPQGELQVGLLWAKKLSVPLQFGRHQPDVGLGGHQLLLASDGPVQVTFDVTGGHERRSQRAASPAAATFTDVDTSPLPGSPVGTGRVPLTLHGGEVVVLVAYEKALAPQASNSDLCLTTPGDVCAQGDHGGGFAFLSPGSTGGSSWSANFYLDPRAGRFDAVSQQETVGLVTDQGLLAVTLG
jgi:hypothetical protein